MIGLYDILRAANGQLFGEPAAQLFTSFAFDPTQVEENQLYVALRADRAEADAQRDIARAIRRGAAGILCRQPPEVDTSGISVLMVRDVMDALMAWAHLVLGKYNVDIIGVTGTMAKAMTIHAIAAVLGQQHQVLRGDLNHNGRIGIAHTLAQLKPEHDFVVLKLDTLQPGDMADMVQAIQPKVGVLTAMDCQYPGAFDSCEHFVDEVATLFEYLSPGMLAVLNADEEHTREIAARSRADIVTVGLDVFGADVMAYNARFSTDQTAFDLRLRDADERYTDQVSQALGKAHLRGLLSALALAKHYQLSIKDALQTLSQLEPLPGRLRPLSGRDKALLIDDTFGGSPGSALASLDWLAESQQLGRRSLFVLGDLDHLGRNSVRAHRAIGKRAAQTCDIFITQGSEASIAARAAIDEGMDSHKVVTTYSPQDVVRALENAQLSDRDVVLIKGGASIRMERVLRGLVAGEAERDLLVRQEQLDDQAGGGVRSLYTSWLEIDADALANNVRTLKQLMGANMTLMAVVKANGYGHGAVTVARTALLNGATYLAVASITEALQLREAGIRAPILIMTYVPVHMTRQAIKQRLTVAVYDLEQARAYNRAARDEHHKLKVHIKLDTGMGRLGIFADEAVQTFRHLVSLEHLDIEGVYTHFSVAKDDPDYTRNQIKSFKQALRPIMATTGFQFQYVHAANSSGLIYEDDIFNMARPGLLMYGLQFSGDADESLPRLQPVMSWKTTVIQVKTFPPGYPIGYGNTYRTRSAERIAFLPVGYNDGLRRSPKPWREVLIHGKRAPVVGRISMEKTAVSVQHIPDVSVGDEVVLLGQQGEDTITAEEIARWLDTINYEVVTSIAPAYPRQ